MNPYSSTYENRADPTAHLRWLADLLDTKFRIFGIRFGWDALLGLVPGFGDLVTNIASLYIVSQAANLGAPASVILRMGMNLFIDNLLDSIPFFGNFADLFWRANQKNVTLLQNYQLNPHRTAVRSRWAVGVAVFLVIASAVASFVLALYAIGLLWEHLYRRGW